MPSVSKLSTNPGCARCGLSALCQSSKADCQLPAPSPVQAGRPLAADDHLVWQGDPVQAIFVLRSGCIKSYVVDPDGTERVRGFYHAGEVVGLESLCGQAASTSLQALTPTTVCRVSRGAILSESMPEVAKTVLPLISKALDQAQTLAGDYSAEQRVARFLLDLREHADDADQLQLEMGRRDIANYLRLVTETVSRVLKRFQDEGLISVKRKSIRILQAKRLNQLVQSAEPIPRLNKRPSCAQAA